MQGLSRLERIFLNTEATYGIIPVAAPTNTDVCRFGRGMLNNDVAVIPRTDKTGSRGITVGTPGRKFCRWSIDMGLSASGVAGTVPRCAPILRAIYGQAPTMPGGNSVVYSLANTIESFTMWDYRQPATMCQRVGHGLLAEMAEFVLGADEARWTCSGTGQWVLESDQWAVADAVEKGGLAAFPVEPAAPSFADGGLTIGFTGEVTIASQVMANIRQMNLRLMLTNQAIRDTFGTFHPTGSEGGEQRFAASFSLYDEDTVAMGSLRTAANDKTPIDINCQIGTVAGNIWTFTIKNVQLASPALNDNLLRWSLDVGDSVAAETTPGARDEFGLTLT